jgi:ER membrane protein complex subunit 3
VSSQTGVFHQKSEKLTPQQQMLTDPSAMTGMMKNNLGMMVPQVRDRGPTRVGDRSKGWCAPDTCICARQVLTMAWVNYFFSGFVVAKVPFPLTQRFREMLQRGVDLQGLDVTYVSSLSWYFLNVFGINGLLQLVLGEATNVNDLQAQQQMMMMVSRPCALSRRSPSLTPLPIPPASPGDGHRQGVCGGAGGAGGTAP